MPLAALLLLVPAPVEHAQWERTRQLPEPQFASLHGHVPLWEATCSLLPRRQAANRKRKEEN